MALAPHHRGPLDRGSTFTPRLARFDVRRFDSRACDARPSRGRTHGTPGCATHAAESSPPTRRSCHITAARCTESRRPHLDRHASMCAVSIRGRVTRVRREVALTARRDAQPMQRSRAHLRGAPATSPRRAALSLDARTSIGTLRCAPFRFDAARRSSVASAHGRRRDRTPQDADSASSHEAAPRHGFTASRAASSAVANAAWKFSPPIGPCRSSSSPHTYSPACPFTRSVPASTCVSASPPAVTSA